MKKKKVYNQIEVDCEVCGCRVQKNNGQGMFIQRKLLVFLWRLLEGLNLSRVLPTRNRSKNGTVIICPMF